MVDVHRLADIFSWFNPVRMVGTFGVGDLTYQTFARDNTICIMKCLLYTSMYLQKPRKLETSKISGFFSAAFFGTIAVLPLACATDELITKGVSSLRGIGSLSRILWFLQGGAPQLISNLTTVISTMTGTYAQLSTIIFKHLVVLTWMIN